VPWYLWQFAEWREHDLTGGLKLVPEPFDDRKGGYVISIWDLLAPTVFGYPATLSVAGYNEGNTFFANAHSPIKGGVSGNTVGGDAFIQVQKRYRKDRDVSTLRFTYSSALLEVMDFGSGKPPWKAPYAQIVMEVDVFQDGVGYVWGLTQTALARSELGIDLHDLTDDIWVLDITGETRGQRAQVVDRTPRWQWNCETCGEAAYGFHTAKLKAPYTQDIDLSAIPHDARLTIYFSLTVRAVDPAQGETNARAFARDPLSGDELTDDGVRFEADGLTELDVPQCDQPGLAGIACLLDTGLPPASCASDVLPDPFEKQVDQARAAVDEALLETSAKKLRKLVKKIGAKLEKADRAITKRETSKRGTKPSASCAADIHAVLGSALDLVGTAICDPASGVLAFDAPSSEISEDGTSVTLHVVRVGGTSGALTASLSAARGLDGATLGLDYTLPAASVTFADGEGGPRDVTVSIVDDRAGEPDEDVTLTLAAPGGCATAGPGSSTVLTIVDDDFEDVASPDTYTVGGIVAGLSGTGLVLEERITGMQLTPGDGPFTFGYAFQDGSPYDVRVVTQPTSPNQICSLTNGAGTIANAVVTDIVVSCITPAANGSLDASFGIGGRVTTGLPASGTALALQSDGGIVVVGGLNLVRYAPDGSLDTTFGGSGTARIVFNGGLLDEALGVTVQPDDKIVVVGQTRVGTRTHMAIARFDAAGTPDTGFGIGGSTTVNPYASLPANSHNHRAYKALIQPDGKILVAGHAGLVDAMGTIRNSYAVARLNPDGSLDTSFGGDGSATASVGGGGDFAYAIGLQSDGKIVLAGRSAPDGTSTPDLGLVRFMADGRLDTDYGRGNNGTVLFDAGFGGWDEAADLVVLGDDSVVVAVQAMAGSTFTFTLVHVSSDGTIGTSSDIVSTPIGPMNDYGRAVALQADGKLVLVGQVSSATVNDFGVVRYTPDGALDPSFGTGGIVTVDFFGASDGANDVAIQPDGKIVVVGVARNGTSNGLGLARLLP